MDTSNNDKLKEISHDEYYKMIKKMLLPENITIKNIKDMYRLIEFDLNYKEDNGKNENENENEKNKKKFGDDMIYYIKESIENNKNKKEELNDTIKKIKDLIKNINLSMEYIVTIFLLGECNENQEISYCDETYNVEKLYKHISNSNEKESIKILLNRIKNKSDINENKKKICEEILNKFVTTETKQEGGKYIKKKSKSKKSKSKRKTKSKTKRNTKRKTKNKIYHK
jgi:hypothetical protein